MPKYSFARCLENSYKVNWTIDGVLGKRQFDLSRRWLPTSLSAASRVRCLNADELRMLSQVEMASYAHLFGYVEEFIAPKIAELAMNYSVDQRVAFDALSNFAAEEVKHMNLFRRVRESVDQTLGFETALVGNKAETARFVLSKSTGAVMLLTACLEWYTQLHYVEAIREDEGLDDLTKRVFKAHWLEESQHAQMDHIETVRAFGAMDDAERESAIDDLIALIGGVDGLLQKQAGLDLQNLERHMGRALNLSERLELHAGVLAAKRWTFLESGVTHPRFQELFQEVATPAQQARVGVAIARQFSAAATAA
jgi:hypothetical protein